MGDGVPSGFSFSPQLLLYGGAAAVTSGRYSSCSQEYYSWPALLFSSLYVTDFGGQRAAYSQTNGLGGHETNVLGSEMDMNGCFQSQLLSEKRTHDNLVI